MSLGSVGKWLSTNLAGGAIKGALGAAGVGQAGWRAATWAMEHPGLLLGATGATMGFMSSGTFGGAALGGIVGFAGRGRGKGRGWLGKEGGQIQASASKLANHYQKVGIPSIRSKAGMTKGFGGQEVFAAGIRTGAVAASGLAVGLGYGMASSMIGATFGSNRKHTYGATFSGMGNRTY